MSHSLNSLKGGYIGDYIGEYYRANYGGYYVLFHLFFSLVIREILAASKGNPARVFCGLLLVGLT